MEKKVKKQSKALKAIFADMVYLTYEELEDDGGYHMVHNDIATVEDGVAWKEFAVYKRIGVGRIRRGKPEIVVDRQMSIAIEQK